MNYHVNVAFITEVAPKHWLFERLMDIRGESYRLHEHSLAARGRKAKASV